MDILERIKMIMKMNQLNAATFADRIGAQRSNVSHVLTGRNKPSLDFIEKVLLEFPKVNASWLICGVIQSPDTTIKEKEILKVAEVINDTTDLYTNVIKDEKLQNPSRKILKIITFYEDFSFDEYRPN